MSNLQRINIEEFLKNTNASFFLIILYDGTDYWIGRRKVKLINMPLDNIDVYDRSTLTEAYYRNYNDCNQQNLEGAKWQIEVLPLPVFD